MEKRTGYLAEKGAGYGKENRLCSREGEDMEKRKCYLAEKREGRYGKENRLSSREEGGEIWKREQVI